MTMLATQRKTEQDAVTRPKPYWSVGVAEVPVCSLRLPHVPPQGCLVVGNSDQEALDPKAHGSPISQVQGGGSLPSCYPREKAKPGPSPCL